MPLKAKPSPGTTLLLLSSLRETTLGVMAKVELDLHLAGYHAASAEVSNARTAIEHAPDDCIVNIHDQEG